ncbi:MAG TPA: hypothetical protein PLM09_13205 [Casimicrobiaceae bacterium]|nr:hypothetical protein [Casimicrobiaceae bacterium]
MHLKDPVELLYLALMLRWERSAPPDKHQGLLDGKPERNTQISRIAYVLRKVGAGTEDHVFNTLARYTRRDDGESYISKNSSWMKEPYPLLAGWYFEGCTSLMQKQSFLQYLTKLGLSSTFVACADDFVSGKSVANYLPTDVEQEEILRKIRGREEKEQRDEA